MGSRDVLVTVQERHRPENLPAGSPQIGPRRMTDWPDCVRRRDPDVRWSAFRHRGRGGYVAVVFGVHVPEGAPAGRGTDRRVVAAGRAGAAGRVPVVVPDGWHAPSPRTAEVVGGQLAVTSYPVPPGRAGPRLPSRRLLDAMPRDDAALYVVEHEFDKGPTVVDEPPPTAAAADSPPLEELRGSNMVPARPVHRGHASPHTGRARTGW